VALNSLYVVRQGDIEELVAAGHEAMRAEDAARALELFQAAVDLGRGDALAEGRLRHVRRRAREGRIESLLALGRVHEATAGLEALLHDDCDRAQDAGGNGDEADVRARGSHGFQGSHAHRSRPHGPPPGSLVGRTSERRLLDAALADVLGGERRIVVVSGEAGIGKTRLVAELGSLARAAGARFVECRPHAGPGWPPYGPWTQALRSLVAACPEDQVTRAFAPHAGQIARLVPEVAEMFPHARAVDPARADVARSRMAEAIASGLGQLARAVPIVVALDDMHRADAASLFVLRYLAASPPVGPLLVLATEDPTAGGRDVAGALATFGSGGSIVSLALERLGADGVAALLASAGCAPLDPERLSDVVECTAGNPFHVLELVRTLDATPGGIGADLPDSGPELLTRRIAELPAATRDLLATAAVAGRVVDLRTLDAIAGDALAILGPALAARILVPVDGWPSQLRFRHDLLWHAVVDGLDGAQRAKLHGRLGAICWTSGDRPMEEVAEHLWLAANAAQLGDNDRAVAVALAAADDNLGMSAVGRAAEHLDRAGRLVATEDRPAVKSERQVQLGARWARLHALDQGLLSPGIAAAVRQAWGAVRGPIVVPEMATIGRLGWMHHMLRGEIVRAHALADDLARRGTTADTPGVLVTGLACLGHVEFQLGRQNAAREALERTLEIAGEPERAPQRLRSDVLRAQAYLGPLLEILGEGARARDMLDGALATTAEPDDAIEIRVAAALAGVIARDPARTAAAAGAVEDIARLSSAKLYLPLAHAFGGWASVRLGDPAGEWTLDEAIEQLDAMGVRWARAMFLGLRADAAVATRRDHDAALDDVDAGLEEVAATGERFYEPELHRLRAELLASVGTARDADLELHRAYDLARSSGAMAFAQRATATARALGFRVTG
jgi:tetratricopeptide (TPR) repeat protein